MTQRVFFYVVCVWLTFLLWLVFFESGDKLVTCISFAVFYVGLFMILSTTRTRMLSPYGSLTRHAAGTKLLNVFHIYGSTIVSMSGVVNCSGRASPSCSGLLSTDGKLFYQGMCHISDVAMETSTSYNSM